MSRTGGVPSAQDETDSSIDVSSASGFSYKAKPMVACLLRTICLGVGLLHIVCILSFVSHFGPWPKTLLVPSFLTPYPKEEFECDPLDETECVFPFPSFHHLEEDETTVTGYRVNLKGLPPMRGGLPLQLDFLNKLDGFSTMAPILFYLEGMKEGHEMREQEGNYQPDQYRLAGPEDIAHSLTPFSTTLLLNVETSEFVPHSAEIDYLDPDRPVVLVIPAIPLNHATHYAVIVHHATDRLGQSLRATEGTEYLLGQSSIHSHWAGRHTRYRTKVLPALEKAGQIAWGSNYFGFSLSDRPEKLLSRPDSKKNGNFELQLLFDFVTISADSQLGPIRAVRDRMLSHLEDPDWNWSEHFHILNEVRYSCDNKYYPVARTIHVEIEVPSFMEDPNSRYSFLNSEILEQSRTSWKELPLGKARAQVQIPCSLERFINEKSDGRPIQTIMEFGHGLFYNREEVQEDFLATMADANGILLFALDWRGMSSFDFPVIIKTLVGDMRWFQAIRDNLIQGYANKLAFHHLTRENRLFELMTLDGRTIPTRNDQTPTSAFYGISQGGILGGGYLSLAGKTKLIDRGVLGVPGTPFAAVLCRSQDFDTYDPPLLLSFYNNRHVRLILSLVQMAWDSVEVSGLLAQPIDRGETLPPILLQAGLGDVEVPTSTAEAMTRAMGGLVLENNPRKPFGIPNASTLEQPTEEPLIVLTELLYEYEYSLLPEDNLGSPQDNRMVHYCVKKDQALQKQLIDFVLRGELSDPCIDDGCRRSHALC